MTASYGDVGGGHAGLALSYHLGRLGRPHVILERGRVAERWRSERWDSLMFQFPNWSLRLPGQEYRGDRPDGFATRDEVIAFIERYRERVGAPVRTGVRVDRVRPTDGGFRLEITDGDVDAVNVVVATGPYQEPILPAVRHAIPPAVLQLHASGYRNPAQLPAGAVLVVGSGASGCQIVEDLLAAGRKVFFSVGRHRRYPRRYRGRDMFWWMERIGALDQTLDERPEARDRPNPLVTGVGGGHEIDLRDYAAAGVTLLGHLRDVTGSRLHLADDLEPLLAAGDESVGVFTRAVDAYIARTGLAVPPKPPRPTPPARGCRRRRFASSIWPLPASCRWSGPPGSGATSGGSRRPSSTSGRADPPAGRHRLRGTLFPGAAVAPQAQVVGAVRGRGRRRPCRRAHHVRCDRCTVAAGAPRPRPDLIRRA
jgi:putative flavoprotein involved in K+ transport